MKLTGLHELISGQAIRFGSLLVALILILIVSLWPASPPTDPALTSPITHEVAVTPSSAAEPYPKRTRPLPSQMVYDAYLERRWEILEEQVDRLQSELPEDVSDWNYGNVFHQYMTLRGLLAIGRDSDIEQAKGFLALAGQTPGSPQLNSFGPNMMLAHALLEHGEFECVDAYLEQCKLFWHTDIGTLETWQRHVRSQQIPEFGANRFLN